MGQQLNPLEMALYRAVDEVLHYVWDPIGASRAPEARNEYHAYLPVVYGLVCRGADVAEIANYLSGVVEYMGLNPERMRDREAASLLLHWKKVIYA